MRNNSGKIMINDFSLTFLARYKIVSSKRNEGDTNKVKPRRLRHVVPTRQSGYPMDLQGLKCLGIWFL